VKPYHTDNHVTLYHGDALDVLRTLPDESVHAVVTDPPYYKVKEDDWDRQWTKRAHYLDWLRTIVAEWQRVLVPNGCVYCFASPDMSTHVELLIAEYFAVLNNIRWYKRDGWHQKAQTDALRSYLSPWEACIFAEQYGSDGIALGESQYASKCDALRGFVFEPLREYLSGEFKKMGWRGDDLNRICGTASMAARHYIARSQWCLPTKEHYNSLQRAANGQALRCEYEALRCEYEDLRCEYEDLRREYEDLRRPFQAMARHREDMWHYRTVVPYPGKHPAQKPLAMMMDIIETSTRVDAVILDCFAGSGTTLVAARDLGRRAIGIEMDAGYCETIVGRLAQQALPLFGEEEA
jgi:site-specific DNA-methyltransferase (adenine-specific)